MTPHAIAVFDELEDRRPAYALVAGVDLVVIRYDDTVSVLYGRCLHRGALLADGVISGEDLICPVHSWDYRYDTGISSYNNEEALQKFTAWVQEGDVLVDADEIAGWARDHPQPYDRDAYLGLYADQTGTPDEPLSGYVATLARSGVAGMGEHGPIAAMGVARQTLPLWDDIQLLTAQLWRPPLLDHEAVGTDVVIGPNAQKPLTLKIPLMVSDMSFGALSAAAKQSLARGAELAGTAICAGEGGMLPEEQAENSRYFYELASARFGFAWEKVAKAQAFHFKGGQASKTGTGGHLPGSKVVGQIAEVRGLAPGTDAISPSRFPEWTTPQQFKDFADEVRDRTGGIPIGFKLSAQHVERDIDAALAVGVDYIILDGRGGGTGAAPTILRDHISVPTIPALARARRHLDALGRQDITLIITGGLRHPADFVKALALGADAVALSTAAMHAIGCIAMRACNTNVCPVGIASTNPHYTSRLVVEKSARRLMNYMEASVALMQVMARACGHRHLNQFSADDLVTWKADMHRLSGVAYGGVSLGA